MRKLHWSIAAAVIPVLLVASAAMGQTVIYEETFEGSAASYAGGAGGDLSYRNREVSAEKCSIDSPTCGLWPEGTYTVDDNPGEWHDLWFGGSSNPTGGAQVSAHGGTNMMIVNASNFPGCTVGGPATVWRSPDINVTVGASYEISYWVHLVYLLNPPTLQLHVNGESAGDAVGVPYLVDDTGASDAWQKVTVPWTADASTAQIILCTGTIDSNFGADFALDDIKLTALTINIDINVHPTSDPNPLNLSSGGSTGMSRPLLKM